MHRTSIGTWAFNIGPYAEQPVPFEEVGRRLAELGFDGMELGGFNAYPSPNTMPEKEQRDALLEQMRRWGLQFSGLAADLWSQHLIDTDDQSAYLAEFEKNADFAVDLGIKGVRVDTVQPPTIHGADRLRHRQEARGRYLEGLRQEGGRARALRHLGGRAGLRLQQALGRAAHPGRDPGRQFRRDVRHLPRPDGRGGRRPPARRQGDAAGRPARVHREALAAGSTTST